MRRGLAVAAVLLIPGAALVAGIVAAFRYVFHGDDMRVSEATRLRLIAEAEAADRARALDDELVVPVPPKVSDGPGSRYDVEVKR